MAFYEVKAPVLGRGDKRFLPGEIVIPENFRFADVTNLVAEGFLEETTGEFDVEPSPKDADEWIDPQPDIIPESQRTDKPEMVKQEQEVIETRELPKEKKGIQDWDEKSLRAELKKANIPIPKDATVHELYSLLAGLQ